MQIWIWSTSRETQLTERKGKRGEEEGEKNGEREKETVRDRDREGSKDGRRKAEGERQTWIVYEYCKFIFAT